MKVLVVGSAGQLGFELMRASWPPSVEVRGVDLPELDVTRADQVDAAVAALGSGVVVNAAAYTAVDKAEIEVELALRVNRDGPAHLAGACQRHGSSLIHVSTDYVFDGTKATAYLETDPAAPVSSYGRSKEAGESMIRAELARHLIVRTSWLYGVHGQNFVKTMLRLSKERDRLRVVDDQYGCPTSAQDLASALVLLVGRIMNDPSIPWGTYHYANRGRTTWCELARTAIAFASRSTGRVVPVDAITTADYPTPARRPASSELDTSRIEQAFGIQPPPWRDSLRRVVDEIIAADARGRASS